MKNYFKINVSKYVSTKNFDIVRPASLDNPKDNAVMFVTEERVKQADALERCKNCLVFWPDNIDVPEEYCNRHAVVKTINPHTDYCLFYRENHIICLPPKEEGIFNNGAWISSKAQIHDSVTIMPGAYVGGECSIGKGTYIGAGVKLVGEVSIGKHVVIRENTVIGADGLTTDRDESGKAVTMPQFGGVMIEDNVLIGANTVIARGAIDNTVICRGAKIDNCCFISHNVHIGEDSFIVGESILFGSSSVGSRTLISGNCAVGNAVHIGNDSVMGMSSTVLKSVPDGVVAYGSPAKIK